MKASRMAGTLGLSAALLMTGALPALAEAGPANVPGVTNATTEAAPALAKDTTPVKAKIGKEEALKRLKEAISIPAGFKLSSTSFNKDGWATENGSWQFGFEKVSNNRTYGNINAMIDAETGKLISYNTYANDPDKQVVYPPKVDYAAAKEIAASLLKKMNPDEAASTLYDSAQDENFIPPLQGEVSYNFRFDRMVNGVRYPTDGISFQIDGTGALQGYQFTWHNSAKFEPMKPAIAADQALDAYKKASKPYLQYIQTTTKDRKTKIALAYRLDTAPLDAIKGSLFSDWSWNPGELKPLTDKPLAPMPAKGQNLTEEEAVAAAKKALPIPASAVLEGANYNEYTNDSMGGEARSTWQINWSQGKGQDAVRYNASVNASNGDILNYNADSNRSWQPLSTEEAAKKLDDAKLQKAAEDFIKKVLPQYSHQLAIVKNENPAYLAKVAMDPGAEMNRTRFFDLQRIVNGIPTETDHLSVNIDRIKGTVVSYYGDISAYDFPATIPSVVESGKALDLLLSPYRLELMYTDPPVTDYSIPWKDRQPAKLVYVPLMRFYDNVYLDAVSGKWIKRETGEETQIGRVTATDIAGHPAQKELQLLIDYKALDVKDGKVNPEQIVTRGEFIKMLVIALNGGNYHPYYAASRSNSYKDVLYTSSYFPYVEAAVDAGILDRTSETLNPEVKMTREEMAQLLVRSLGFDKLAAKSDLFNLTVKDGDQVKLKGQAAIVLSLGIMEKAADGSFLPASEVTRAEAAVTFYKFLQVRPTMQSSPIRNYY